MVRRELPRTAGGGPRSTPWRPRSVSLASISERRLYRLLDEHQSNGLPPFLVHGSGLNSGFMLVQYTAASLVSECEVARPPGVGRLDPLERRTGGPREHGHDRREPRAGVVANAETVVALEALGAAQALDLRAPLEPGPATRAVPRRSGARAVLRGRPRVRPRHRRCRDLVRDGRLIDGRGGRVGGLRLVHGGRSLGADGDVAPTIVATTGSWPGRYGTWANDASSSSTRSARFPGSSVPRRSARPTPTPGSASLRSAPRAAATS